MITSKTSTLLYSHVEIGEDVDWESSGEDSAPKWIDWKGMGVNPDQKGEHLTFGRVNVAIATLCLEGRQGAIPQKKPWQ